MGKFAPPENGSDGSIVGGLYPTNLYSDLPASNTDPLPFTINGIDYTGNEYQWWWEAINNEELIQYIGTFTTTLTNLPEPPEGYQFDLINTGAGYGSWQGTTLSGEETLVTSGFYAIPEQFSSAFDVPTTWYYAAFSATDTPGMPTYWTPIWMSLISVTFEPIPEPSSAALLLLGAGACFLRKRRKL